MTLVPVGPERYERYWVEPFVSSFLWLFVLSLVIMAVFSLGEDVTIDVGAIFLFSLLITIVSLLNLIANKLSYVQDLLRRCCCDGERK